MNNKSITFEECDCKLETASTWLVGLMKFGIDYDIFKPLEEFTIKMKEVDYTVYQKLMTILMSIASGCENTKDINNKLANEKLAANMFDMERFPDQSQINELLRRFDANSIKQFKDIHHCLFMTHGDSINSEEPVVIDVDQSGLLANGKTYCNSSKGYFAKKKNQKGYQLSAAFAGGFSETVSMYLDPGNTHCQDRSEDILNDIIAKYKHQLIEGKLILRTDSGYGSSNNIDKISSIPGLKFVAKGYSTVSAIGKDIPFSSYSQVDEAAWVYELPEKQNGKRIVIVQILTPKGSLEYSMLITNIPENEMSTLDIFKFYNQRQTIEAFFKMIKNTYNVTNLRTRNFEGIASFLWLVFITHNLITWFKSIVLTAKEFATLGVRALIKSFGNITSIVQRNEHRIKVIINTAGKLAELFAKSLINLKARQLSFWD